MTNSLLQHIEEPRLGFGYGQELEHPKDGLFLFGPLDDKANPAEMRIGVIGTPDGLSCFREWGKSIQSYIHPGEWDKPHHASWPGFQAVFATRWPEEPLVELPVQEKEVRDSLRISDRYEAIYKTVELFVEPIRRHLRQEEAPPAVWFVVIPEEVHRYGRPKSSVPREERIKGKQFLTPKSGRKILREGSLFPEDREAAEIYRYELNFHHQMKARLLEQKAVLQIVRDTTLTPHKFVQNNRPIRNLQDPATVAWNLCTTAFFKASGKPWKLASVRPGVCYVGLVYKQDHTDPAAGNACCGAQMFLDSGDGVVFRGAVGPWYSEKLKEYHLNKEKASELMSLVVEAYRDLHGRSPAELFIHGKTRFNDDEWEGFKSVVPNETHLVGVRIRSTSELKLYRAGKMPVLRGTAYLPTERTGYLWTKGFIPRLDTYPGWEVPNPLLIQIHRGKADLLRVMTDVMGLTKINFNTCQFADGQPVTLKFADAVGEILTAAPVPDLPPLPFRHYI